MRSGHARLRGGPRLVGCAAAVALAACAVLAPGRCAEAAPGDTRELSSKLHPLNVETVTEGLEHPWGLAFLPDGRMLVTERPGRLRVVSKTGALSPPLRGLKDVDDFGQGGLLDIALDPDFPNNRTLYYCHAERRPGGGYGTSVSRARLTEQPLALDGAEVIFRQVPAGNSGRHFGCRLVFDRSGALFVTTGDRGNKSDSAQDPNTHIGKVLRLTLTGAPADAKPAQPGWRPEIWSIGHRNIQGAALHPETGALWTVEHGSKGGDEINRPERGKNYGWPVISYGTHYTGAKIGVGTHAPGMEQPIHYWDPSIAPSGMTFYDGSLFPGWRGDVFVGALAGRHLARLHIKDGKVADQETMLRSLGERIRDVRQGPDGALYLLTDDPDGRILRLTPAP